MNISEYQKMLKDICGENYADSNHSIIKSNERSLQKIYRAEKNKKIMEAQAFILGLEKKAKKCDVMSKLKLIKVLYRADRISIERQGLPLTLDSYQALDYGMAAHKSYDICNRPIPYQEGILVYTLPTEEAGFQKKGTSEVVFVHDEDTVDLKRLSKFDKNILSEAYEVFKNANTPTRVIEESHSYYYPEWTEDRSLQERGLKNNTNVSIRKLYEAAQTVLDDSRYEQRKLGNKLTDSQIDELVNMFYLAQA